MRDTPAVRETVFQKNAVWVRILGYLTRRTIRTKIFIACKLSPPSGIRTASPPQIGRGTFFQNDTIFLKTVTSATPQQVITPKNKRGKTLAVPVFNVAICNGIAVLFS